MSIKLKRRLTYGTIILFNLCNGLSYAIIFPTIWDYIHKRLGGQSYMLGVVIAAYSFSSFFANPIVGWWSDKKLNTRLILLVTILAEAIGSTLYFVGMHTWVLVVGRLVAGIGAGGGAAVLADITRTTSEEDRTPVLSVVIASRQLGLIIGPGFDIFLSQVDFTMFSLPVDKYTAPGLFMTVVWLFLEIMVLFFYYNLTTLRDNEDVEKLFQNYNSIITGSIPYSDLDNLSTLEVALTSSYPPYSGSGGSMLDPNVSGTIACSISQPNLQVEWLEDSEETQPLKREEIQTIECQKIPDTSGFPRYYDKSPVKRKIHKLDQRAGSVSDRMIESAERIIQSTSGSYGNYLDGDNKDKQEEGTPKYSSTNPSTPYSSEPVSMPDESTSLLGNIRQDYFRDDIVVLLGLAFISCFSQTVLETIVTPLSQEHFKFTEKENSYIYLFAGIEVIVVFAAIKFISRKLSDRLLIIIGLITLIISMVLPMLYVPSSKTVDTSTLPYFIITIIVDLIGIAIIVVCSASLLSKITNEDSQALFQGLRRSMVSLGCVMGPLWGGAFLFNIYFLFSVPLAVTVLIMVLFIMSYKKLNVERL
ncbi:hypothetical protein JTE90_004622 [Oedothorax gibbosus]|uniref:Major facilitator superfamily (MFS) profile domain-containing protein n=1 Tax=Oedothorax gibbosus TaxID=931172 RepID=A0AAV6URL3_9ARAC|nr:hypothetical protein JTE90_004622 [Oedothorax gibbosus]